MLLDEETLRFIFGFKLRGLRQEKDLSLKKLAQLTGLSPSYINEIEKGKKYPKGDKVLLLARALGVTYDELTSLKLKKELGIIAQILGNNLIRGLPFDIFGIPARTLFELMAEQPQNFSTLVGTILELGRNHNIRVEDLFQATLRAYLDMNNNYFPELEKAATNFRKELQASRLKYDLAGLKSYLTKAAGYVVEERDFAKSEPRLKGMHFHLSAGKTPRLLLNQALTEKEKLFILTRECGYFRLGIRERLRSNLQVHVDSFDALFGNFRAAYFASAALLPREEFIAEAEDFFARRQWDEHAFVKWVDASVAPAPTFFHRLLQTLPAHFGLEQIFFLRFDFDPAKKSSFRLLRELHLSELHAPHDIRNAGHYCRRWITTQLLQSLGEASGGEELAAGVQRSRYFGIDKEYLCLSLAYRKELATSQVECVTIGIKVDSALLEKVRFAGDASIPTKIVSDTCENCGVLDCRERAGPPVHLEARRAEREVELALESLG